MKKQLLILIAFSLSLFSYAEPPSEREKPNGNCSFNFYLENDLFSDTDRYYTNGLRFSFLFEDIEADGVPEPLLRLNKKWKFLENGYTHNVGLAFGQDIFTPEDISRRDLIKDDRPYAGWLYGSLSLHRKSATRLHKLELTLGIVGPEALAGEAQNWVHEIRDFETAHGWDNQLDFEPGIILHYEYKRRYAKSINDTHFGVDLIPGISLKAGNIYTEAGLSSTFRFGWNVPRDFHGNRISASSYATPPKGESYTGIDKEFSLYGFVTVGGRAVARNIFLDGNTFKDSHNVNREEFVGEIEAGFGIRWRGIRFTYAQVLQTREFEEQNGDQRFGSISINLFF